MMEKIQAVNDLIDNATNEQQAILTTLRTLIETAVPNAVEQVKWSRPVYATAKDFCYLQANKKYISLGFFNFEKIDDPQNLLAGTGKQMRHIKIANPEEIKTDMLTKMLRQAAKF